MSNKESLWQRGKNNFIRLANWVDVGGLAYGVYSGSWPWIIGSGVGLAFLRPESVHKAAEKSSKPIGGSSREWGLQRILFPYRVSYAR